jgi:hypothetical protein
MENRFVKQTSGYRHKLEYNLSIFFSLGVEKKIFKHFLPRNVNLLHFFLLSIYIIITGL